MTRFDLITNRTQADVEAVLALIRLNRPIPPDDLKASWDWRAMNRVEGFSEQIKNELLSLGYVISLVTKINWTPESIADFPAEGLRILENLNTLKRTFAVLPTTPDTPTTITPMTITEANAIEQILFDLDFLLAGYGLPTRELGWFGLGTDPILQALPYATIF